MSIEKNPLLLKNIYFGKAEAEAENVPQAEIHLNDVFDDYLGLLEQVESDGRFIIVGRKGTGKSALSRYYDFEEKEKSNTFSTYINAQTINFHSLLQTGRRIKEKHSVDVQNSAVFKWIILINLADQLMKNEGVKNLKGFNDLLKFFEINSGYINLGGDVLEKTIESHKANVNIEAFSSFYKTAFGSEFTTEKHAKKAPFISLIPALEQTIIYLTRNEFCYGTKYRLIFDDLDELFETSEEDVDNIISLIRILKAYNTELFSAPDVDIKIIVCIRPDQLSSLIYQSGISKTLESYAVKIEWYKHNQAWDDEDNVPLKKLINARLEKSFAKNNVTKGALQWWDRLIDSNDYNSKSSFREIIKYTFNRPRDLINLLNTLKERYPERRLPIQKTLIDASIPDFSTKLGEEVTNELAMLIKKEDIDKFFTCLRKYDDEVELKEVRKNYPAISTEEFEKLITAFYKYDVIGIRNNSDLSFYGWGDAINITNENCKLVKHFGLRPFLSKKAAASKWW